MLDCKKEQMLHQIMARIAYANCDNGYGYDESFENFYAQQVWIPLDYKDFCEELGMSLIELRKLVKELMDQGYVGVVKDGWSQIVYLTSKSIGLTDWKCDFWEEV